MIIIHSVLTAVFMKTKQTAGSLLKWDCLLIINLNLRSSLNYDTLKQMYFCVGLQINDQSYFA